MKTKEKYEAREKKIEQRSDASFLFSTAAAAAAIGTSTNIDGNRIFH